MTTVLQIQTIVAGHYGVRLVHLRSRDRTRDVSWARHVSMYFARKLTNLTLTAIGNGFGRDHGTVMHAIEHVKGTMDVDARRRLIVEALEAKLTGAIKEDAA